MKIQNVAKAAVINPTGLILLLRRSHTDTRRPGEWDFPGGELETGEYPAQAAARELFEEAGIQADVTDFAMIYCATQFYEPDTESVNRTLFVCRVSEEQAAGIKLSFEHDAFKWVSVGRALKDFPHFFYSVGLQYAVDHNLLGV